MLSLGLPTTLAILNLVLVEFAEALVQSYKITIINQTIDISIAASSDKVTCSHYNDKVIEACLANES